MRKYNIDEIAHPRRKLRSCRTYEEFERIKFKDDPLYEEILGSAKRADFTSLRHREIYKILVEHYKEKLLKIYVRPIGYDIERIEKKEKGNLVITLLEDDGFTETNYKDGLETIFKTCSWQLPKIVPEENFTSSYEDKTLIIIPYNFPSRAFLEAYTPILKKEIVKKES